MTSANSQIRSHFLLLIAFCGFLFFYGLGAFGLLGADEPRYAQIAREMLDRGDWITPVLNGKPWLEKPPLYYWQTMLAYRVGRSLPSRPEATSLEDGLRDQLARFPSAIDAAFLIAIVYLFLRRFRPGTELDGALITASCAGIIGFAHAAATDMPLTATFSVALLAWYAWYENRRRSALAIFYLFLALGMLAKGPVAPALAGVIVVPFAALKRDRKIVLDTLWPPGILLFLVVTLPWYVAVQLRNPEFFRFFILEHNLARFSSNVYHHPQPFWFYLPVFLLAVMPWTVWLIAAVVAHARQFWSGGCSAFAGPEDSWTLFLLIWMFVPVLFFSASQSKLPAYILPAVPAAALLVTDYLAARREGEVRTPWWLAAVHGLLCGLLAFGALSAASIAATHHLARGPALYVAAALGLVIALGIIVALLTSAGPRLVRSATMIAVIVSVAAVIRFAAPVIDATQSSRPIAVSIQSFSQQPVPVALYHVNRIVGYGLDFYLNRPTLKYEAGEIPREAHVVVAASGTDPEFRALVGSRKVSYLTSVPAQKLQLYWIAPE